MAHGPDLWPGVVSERRCRGLGSVSLRALGVRCPVGMDVGGRRTLGLCALSLWTLGVRGRRLGLGSWTGSGRGSGLRAARVRSGAGGIRRRGRIRCGHRHRRSRRSRRGLVSSGPARCMGSLLSRERCLHGKCERDEFARDQQNGNYERLQHDDYQQNYGRESDLHVPELAGRGDRSFEDRIPEWRAGGEGCSSGEFTGNSTRTRRGDCGNRSHSQGCRRTERSGEGFRASSCDAGQQTRRNEDGSFGSRNSGRPNQAGGSYRIPIDGQRETCYNAASRQIGPNGKSASAAVSGKANGSAEQAECISNSR